MGLRTVSFAAAPVLQVEAPKAEVERGLRTALGAGVPGLAKATLGEEVEVRHAVFREEQR